VNVWLVARREIVTKLHDRAYLIGIAVMVFILLGTLVGNTLLSRQVSSSPDRVATVGPEAAQVADAAGLVAVPVDDVAAGEALLRAPKPDTVKAIATVDGNGRATLIGLESVGDRVSNAFTVQPDVQLLEPPKASQGVMFAVSFAFAILFLIVSLTFGMGIAQSVVEEKETRVVELLVAAIPVRVLLAGKIVGNVLLAFGQLALFVLLGLAAMRVMDSPASLSAVLNRSVLWFLVYFVLGFAMMACLWAVCGSMATRQEDLGSVTMPMQVILMIPFFVATYSQSSNVVLRMFSYIPFTSPIAMPKRVVLGDASGWDLALSLALLVVTIVLVIGVSARIYQGALLQTTGKANLRRAWSASASPVTAG
jgi:ABC-2 type transport system permease protein